MVYSLEQEDKGYFLRPCVLATFTRFQHKSAAVCCSEGWCPRGGEHDFVLWGEFCCRRCKRCRSGSGLPRALCLVGRIPVGMS